MKHEEQHLRSSDFISDIVIGMSDGLTVPFALAAGLSGAVSSNTVILTAGVAEIVAGCIAMGLGGYLAGKTEQDHYQSELKREYQEVEDMPEEEIGEVKAIFKNYGIDDQGQTLIAEALSQQKDKWVDFMMRFELGLEKPNPNRARNSALTIGLAYAVGGFLPLLAYFFTDRPQTGLKLSIIITTLCLFIFGYFKSKVTGQPVWAGALKVTSVGLIAAAAAFGIAKLIS